MEKKIYIGIVSNPETNETIGIKVFEEYENSKKWIDDLVDGQIRIEGSQNARVVYRYDKDRDTHERPDAASFSWRFMNPLYIVQVSGTNPLNEQKYITERLVIEENLN